MQTFLSSREEFGRKLTIELVNTTRNIDGMVGCLVFVQTVNQISIFGLGQGGGT